LSAIVNYEKENIPEVCLKSVQPYLDDPEFDPEVIRRQSVAAAGLCAWVINIVKYYEVYCEVRMSAVFVYRLTTVMSYFMHISPPVFNVVYKNYVYHTYTLW